MKMCFNIFIPLEKANYRVNTPKLAAGVSERLPAGRKRTPSCAELAPRLIPFISNTMHIITPGRSGLESFLACCNRKSSGVILKQITSELCF